MAKSYMIKTASGREFAIIDGEIHSKASGVACYMGKETEKEIDAAIRAKFAVPDCLELWQWPDSYGGAKWYGFVSVVSRHRDSDCLTESNFETAREMLGDCATIVRESHWAVGWVEWVAVDCRNAKGIEIAARIVSALSDYPVLNDSDYSAREWERAQENWADSSIRERAELCKRAGLSIYSARRDSIPQEDNGFIFERMAGY